MARLLSVDANWPEVGSQVVWQSGPAGRGRVTERVVVYEPLAGLSLNVQDDSLEGCQQVAFEPADGGVEILLTLDYRIKRRTPLTSLIERLFVRRPMITSLTKTLERFAAVLATSRAAGLG